MSKCRRCRELFRSVLRSVQAIKLLKDSVCKKLFPEFFDSPTHQFEKDGIDSSAASQPGASSLEDEVGFMDGLIFLDSECVPPALTVESTDTGLTYPTNLESTNLVLQSGLGWFHQTGEILYDAYGDPSYFTLQPVNGDLPLLHEQRTAMYETDEIVFALSPGSPQPNCEGPLLHWTDAISLVQNLQDPTSFVCQTVDTDAPYQRLVECEQVAKGDDWYIPQLPSTQARKLGWCAIRNMVRACKIFLSRIRSRMGLKRKCKIQDDDYAGVRCKKSRPDTYVCECRLSRPVHGIEAGKVWLGSFSTKEKAARAYDVGRMLCSKRAKGLNFPESKGILSILKDIILHLPLHERKKAIKDVAKEYGDTGHINGCTRKYCFPAIKPIPIEFRSR